jgi:hypothetical protein
MKIFNIKNTKHQEILKEELIRVKRILLEGSGFSMDEIWAAMTEDERFDAIAASRDDIDAAERYSNEIWDSIPDSITDSLDLSEYELAKYDQGGRTNLRSIDFQMSKQGVDKLVNKYLQKVGRARKNDLTLSQSYDLLTKINQFIQSTTKSKPFTSVADDDVKQAWLDAERRAGRRSGLD